MHSIGRWVLLGSILACISAPIHGQVTLRASVSSSGAQGNGFSDGAAPSIRGRFVAFSSNSTNLIPLDSNGTYEDIFVRDLQAATTELISRSSAAVQGDLGSVSPSLSSDGRYVTFVSNAHNLVPDDTNNLADIFVRDRTLGITERVSVSTAGAECNAYCIGPHISGDGRYVVFYGGATNLVPGDTNNDYDIFLHDRALGTTERVNLSSAGAQANQSASAPAISPEGAFVAFQSTATNLAPVGTPGLDNVFVRDLSLHTTVVVSVAVAGAPGNSDSDTPSLSSGGRFIAFESKATNLVQPATPSGLYHIYVRDMDLATTELVSVSSNGVRGNDASHGASISADGRYVSFWSAATNLVTGDTNGVFDVFVHDRETGITERASISSAGAESNAQSRFPAISMDGDEVAFMSEATNLVPNDTAIDDIFVRDREASHFTSLCEPDGIDVVCPCGNPPLGVQRGCNNSAGTGGAGLTASGAAYLSMDGLSFTTHGETPTASSWVLQGATGGEPGHPFGQGVSCVGGFLARLYFKQAVGGSISAPDSGAGDLSVSMRSAALGDPIAPGQYRYYFVYYRDPNVLGGCPSSSTFNATQSARITWFP